MNGKTILGLILVVLTMTLVACNPAPAEAPTETQDTTGEQVGQNANELGEAGKDSDEKNVEANAEAVETDEDTTEEESSSESPCGNNVCEEGEDETNCPVDCFDCDDGNHCTEDIYNTKHEACVHPAIEPCCGNNKCEEKESCDGCFLDCSCISFSDLTKIHDVFSNKQVTFLYGKDAPSADADLIKKLQSALNLQGSVRKETGEDVSGTEVVLVGNPCEFDLLHTLLSAKRGGKYKEEKCEKVVKEGYVHIELVPTSRTTHALLIAANTDTEKSAAIDAVIKYDKNGFSGMTEIINASLIEDGVVADPEVSESGSGFNLAVDFDEYPEFFLNHENHKTIYIVDADTGAKNEYYTEMFDAMKNYMQNYFNDNYPKEKVTVKEKSESSIDEIKEVHAVILGNPWDSTQVSKLFSKKDWDKEVEDNDLGMLVIYEQENATQVVVTGSDTNYIITAGRLLGLHKHQHELKGTKITASGPYSNPVVATVE